MTNETALLALLESREAEANAKAEWIAEWTATNRPLLLAGMLETDPATLLGELNAALATLAKEAWGYHLAALHDAMNEEQWEQYQFNHQRTAA